MRILVLAVVLLASLAVGQAKVGAQGPPGGTIPACQRAAHAPLLPPPLNCIQ